MELNLHYHTTIFSAKLTSNISIKDIILNLPEKLRNSSKHFAVLNSNNEKLKETDTIIFKDSSIVNLYLIPLILPSYQQPIAEHKSTPEQQKKKLDELSKTIMQCTHARKQIKTEDVKQYHQTHSSHSHNILEQFLMNYHSFRLIRDYDYANSHNYDEHGNIEPNENYVRDLKEMGFPEDRARQALITSRNNLSRATDILLNGDLEEVEGGNNNNNSNNNNNNNNQHNDDSNENEPHNEGDDASVSSELFNEEEDVRINRMILNDDLIMNEPHNNSNNNTNDSNNEG